MVSKKKKTPTKKGGAAVYMVKVKDEYGGHDLMVSPKPIPSEVKTVFDTDDCEDSVFYPHEFEEMFGPIKENTLYTCTLKEIKK